ncbi:integrase [Parabacteroides sp. PF5-5]|uniref:tyrosine-type recombinase/integrase n=1 Tax=unclassified Parabacteroides TaxID=2649774 RepID=UPI0024760920|nr:MULTISPECIES: site-specific integrase [unclassified Parabacteroides]MDH6304368.1 integrase [Parabacteroides sp. PH5-39]MDH6315479.1 integrase [Parabacteroides sp. PF5-13]MDH6319027.1 integrase [Parabacteroides sp. PH5-13]MDH6322757.1 integrase [Parabacteroides sp. PH5-8]MDH6326671.1 integrase [Parabacteroides sp. PH5-41]
MATIAIFLRPSAKGVGFPGSVYIRVIHRRKVLTVTMPYRLFVEEWDVGKGFVVFPPGVAAARRGYLREVEEMLRLDVERLKEHIRQLEAEGVEYTVQEVLAVLRYRSGCCMLKGYAAVQSALLKLRGQERTAEAYLSAMRSFVMYNGGCDLSLRRLDELRLCGYEAWLKERRLTFNTISFYMRNLRALYNRAVLEGLIEAPRTSPFSQVYTGVQATKKRALSKTEMRILDKLDLLANEKDTGGSGLRQALDIFLFCFHARGMSFVDVAYLKKSDVCEGLISYLRRKTGQLLEIRITPAMQEIIDRYTEETAGSPFLFPLIREADKPLRRQYLSALRLQNSRLGRIARLSGLQKKLTTHCSRHSWATIAKGEHLPLWVISEGLGHSNEKTTYTYLASFERTVLDKAVEKVSRAIKKAG